MYKLLTHGLALTVAVFFGFSTPARAQDAAAPDQVTAAAGQPPILSLDDLLRDLRANNPSLRQARIGADALGTRREQVASLPDPAVMASYRPLGFDAAIDAVPSLSIQQAIPFPGKLALAGRAADYTAQAAALRADAFAKDLILQAKLAYYDLYLAQELDRLTQQFQQTLGEFENAATVRYEVGQGTQQAILKAQVEKNSLVRQRLTLAAQRRTLIEALARLTNRPDLVAHAGDVIASRPTVQVDTARAAEVALAERPEVAALQAEMGSADAEVALARKSFLPDFVLQGGFMDMGGMNGLTSLGNRFMIGGGITIPLQTGRRRAALEEAKLRRSQLDAQYEALQTEIQTRINALNNELREGARALALYEHTLVPQAQSTLDATLSAYTTGQVDFLDLLDAERMLFNVNMEKERTYADYLKSAAELERVIGVDTLSDPLLAQTN